ncbi:MAG TPA: class I SAM-dependent methyltransferase [Hyphomicrobiales bacterium]|nr:class I SAM-dependent methyltransferase [Hyphomicrobiales bacterium]
MAGQDEAAGAYRASDGASYDRFLGRWTRRLAEAFADFAGLPEAGAVLDVGCGTGSLAATIAQRRPACRVVGIDRAAPYVAFASGARALPNLRFQEADAATALPFADGTFDAVLAQLVMNFLPDPAAALREMARAARPGAVVAACVWDFAGGLVYQRLLWDTLAGTDPAAGAVRDRLFSHPLAQPDGLRGLWTTGGLATVATASLTIRMDYESFDDYWQPLRGGQGPVGSYVAALAGVRQACARELVRAAYLSGRPDGPRSLTATAWAVRGLAPGRMPDAADRPIGAVRERPSK